jgi:small subunit ribosomal protein S20
MANIKSAAKRNRQAAHRRARNVTGGTRLKHTLQQQRSAESRHESLPLTFSQIDRALRKGLIHRNTAARYKSRLSRAAGPAPAAAKGKRKK